MNDGNKQGWVNNNISPGTLSALDANAIETGSGGIVNMVKGLTQAGNILGKQQKGIIGDANVTPIDKKKIPGLFAGRGR